MRISPTGPNVCDCEVCTQARLRRESRARKNVIHEPKKERESAMVFRGKFPKVRLRLTDEDILASHGEM